MMRRWSMVDVDAPRRWPHVRNTYARFQMVIHFFYFSFRVVTSFRV